MMERTEQQIVDELIALHARSVNIVQGTISSAANPRGTVTFTYRNPIDGKQYTAQGTAWNQCSPSQVSALKQTDGSWIVVGQHESATVRESVHTDRRAKPKLEAQGDVLMWLDYNWLEIYRNQAGAIGAIPEDDQGRNQAFFEAILRYFLKGRKEIYTLSNADPRLLRPFYFQDPSDPAFDPFYSFSNGFDLLSYPIAAPVLARNGITVIRVSKISEAGGLFFLPSLNPFNGSKYTPEEFSKLRAISRRYGLLVSTDSFAYAIDGYNESVLRGLKIRSNIHASQSFGGSATYYTKAGKIAPATTIVGSDWSYFSGLKPNEKLAVETSGDVFPVFALLKSN